MKSKFPQLELAMCMQTVDNILKSNVAERNDHLDRVVAHYLAKYGYKDWFYNDDFSGPELNETSYQALRNIADDGRVYNQMYRVVRSANAKGEFFRTEMLCGEELSVFGKKLKYDQIDPNNTDYTQTYHRHLRN